MDEDTEQLDWGDIADDNVAMGDEDDAISLGGADDDLQELQKYQAAKGVDTESPTTQHASPINSLAKPTSGVPARRGSPQQTAEEKSTGTQRSVSPLPPNSSAPRQNSRRPPVKAMATPTGPLALPPKPAATLPDAYITPASHSLTEASAMTVRPQRDRDREWDRRDRDRDRDHDRERERERERVGSTSRARDERVREDRVREDRVRDDRVRDDRVREDRVRNERVRDERVQDRVREERGRDDRGREDRVRDNRIDELPAGWKMVKSSQGSDYYFNVGTLQTQWERPMENPPARHAHPDAYPVDSSSDYPQRPNPRRFASVSGHAEPASSWSGPARRDTAHYSPEQSRLPLSRAPQSHSPQSQSQSQPPPPPPPVRPSQRPESPPRAGRAAETANANWRPQTTHENNDRSWRPTPEDERRWEDRERDRTRERRDRDRDVMITERDKEREPVIIRGSLDRERERVPAQVPSSKERRPRPRSPDHNTRRPNGSVRNDSHRGNVPLSSDTTAARHRSPPSSTPTAGSASTGQDDARTLNSTLTSPQEPSIEHDGGKKPDVLPSPTSATDSDVKRRRTGSDPDSARMRRPSPEDVSYASPANDGESPRKRKPLPPQDEVLRGATLTETHRSAPPTEALNSSQGNPKPHLPIQRDRGYDGPTDGPRDRIFENPSGMRADVQVRRVPSFRGEGFDERVPIGPRADRGPPGMPTPPTIFRGRRDSISRRNEELGRSPQLPPGTSLQLETGPPMQARMVPRFGPPNPTGGEWHEPPHPHQPQREIAGKPSRFNDNSTQNDMRPHMVGNNEAAPAQRRASFKQSPQTLIVPSLPPPSVPLGSRIEAPPPPKLVNSQEGFYPSHARAPAPIPIPAPAPEQSPDISPVQEHMGLPAPLRLGRPRRPALASRMSGMEFSQREEQPHVHVRNEWVPRGRRGHSFRENGTREEGMHRQPPPNGSFEHPDTQQRFGFSERIAPPGPEHYPKGVAGPGPARPPVFAPKVMQPSGPGALDMDHAGPRSKASLLERMGDRFAGNADAGPSSGPLGGGGDEDVDMDDAQAGAYGGPRRRMTGPRNGNGNTGGYIRRGMNRRR